MSSVPTDEGDAKALRTMKAFCGSKPVDEAGENFCFLENIQLPRRRSDYKRWNVDLVDLLRRAHRGDRTALERLVIYIRGFCHELELLVNKDPVFVKSIACEFFDWPVLYSLKRAGKNAKNTKLGKMLIKLDVGGEHAFRADYPSQKYDPDNLWTRYAKAALQCIRINQFIVPAVLKKCQRARKCQVSFRHFRTVHKATLFDVGARIVLVKQWQEDCIPLPRRLTKKSAKMFMMPAKFALREFWIGNPEYFAVVKQETANSVRYQTDGQYLDKALSAIEQAMRALGHK